VRLLSGLQVSRLEQHLKAISDLTLSYPYPFMLFGQHIEFVAKEKPIIESGYNRLWISSLSGIIQNPKTYHFYLFGLARQRYVELFYLPNLLMNIFLI